MINLGSTLTWDPWDVVGVPDGGLCSAVFPRERGRGRPGCCLCWDPGCWAVWVSCCQAHTLQKYFTYRNIGKAMEWVGGAEEENEEGAHVPRSRVLLSEEHVSCGCNLLAKTSAPITAPISCCPLCDATSLCVLSLRGRRTS